ncbi:MAG TPA: hypothetical protein PLH57_09805 [Oligoflexia bacterium]|nr:hypothetical protein [Oligoflexia bacterium]
MIWFIASMLYGGAFWWKARFAEPSLGETKSIQILAEFSQSTFPPKIDLVRSLDDYGGHLAYYALMGRVHQLAGGDLLTMRTIHLCVVLAALFVFTLLGFHYTYRNRLNPLWISLGTLLLAANPYLFEAAMRVGYIGFFLFVLLASLWALEKERTAWATLLLSLGVLVDWRAVILVLVTLWTRTTGETGRFVRIEKILLLALPLVFASLPLFAWKGIVPTGETREWWTFILEHRNLVRLDLWFYSIALLPIYSLFFSWSWGFRARARSMSLGAVAAALLIPMYFIFPVVPQPEPWAAPGSGNAVPLGLVDWALTEVAGPYKNLVLFVPWIVGAFLFAQAILLDILERSRVLRAFILFFFLVAPVSFGVVDQGFLIVLPFVLLFGLSEALVGDEGKIV